MAQSNPSKSGRGGQNKEVAKPFDISMPEIDVIPEDVKPILKGMPIKDQQIMVRALVSVSRTFAGPIPPPDLLAGYNDIIPDGAERILRMAEKQSDHRMEMEKTVIGRELNQSGRGQNYAVIIVILVLLISAALIYTDHDLAGGALGVVDLGAIAWVFIAGKYAQKKDLAKKK